MQAFLVFEGFYPVACLGKDFHFAPICADFRVFFYWFEGEKE